MGLELLIGLKTRNTNFFSESKSFWYLGDKGFIKKNIVRKVLIEDL
jgi:hypothetical protein